MNFGVFGPVLSTDDVAAHRGRARSARATPCAPLCRCSATATATPAVRLQRGTHRTDGRRPTARKSSPMTARSALPTPRSCRRASTPTVSAPRYPAPSPCSCPGRGWPRSRPSLPRHLPDDREVQLPPSLVALMPQPAANGTAPAGTRFEVPYAVRGAAASSGLRALRFEVPYDETATWRPVADFGARRLVLDHPRGTGSASLRFT